MGNRVVSLGPFAAIHFRLVERAFRERIMRVENLNEKFSVPQNLNAKNMHKCLVVTL